MDILTQLFVSGALVKIIRFFYLNSEAVFDIAEITRRIDVSSITVKKELSRLKKINFILKGSKNIILEERRGDRVLKKKKKISGWRVNPNFLLYRPLKNLVLNTAPVARKELIQSIKKSGRPQLIVLSGFFLGIENDHEPRVDMLIVGDNIKRRVLDRVTRGFESKIGKELNYALLTTKEFRYRKEMQDKFLRDIFDYPHEKILNKLDV